MFFWILKQIVISLILILLIHYLYFFFKKNLTEPKVKDLVNGPKQEYREIAEAIGKTESDAKPIDTTHMKTELKNYLKTLTKNENDIASADNFNTNYQTI